MSGSAIRHAEAPTDRLVSHHRAAEMTESQEETEKRDRLSEQSAELAENIQP